jgi:hypothetical protein
VPWALVGLVAVASLVGAVVGVSNQPTQLPVSGTIATTRAAGTARFTNLTVTIRRSPLRRSVTRASGTVDFRSGSMTTVERSTDTAISPTGSGPTLRATNSVLETQIWISHTLYFHLRIAGQHFPVGWVKTKLPAGSPGPLGMLDEVAPIGNLEGELALGGTKVELLGPDVLAGKATTRYQVVVPDCSGTPTSGSPPSRLGSIDVWLDDQGRLVQVRDTRPGTDPTRPFAGSSTSTVRLFDFGVPATISAPRMVLPTARSGLISFSLSTKACPG